MSSDWGGLREEMATELTLSSDTSVTSPSGPASDGSSTSVLAPEICRTHERARQAVSEIERTEGSRARCELTSLSARMRWVFATSPRMDVSSATSSVAPVDIGDDTDDDDTDGGGAGAEETMAAGCGEIEGGGAGA